MKLVIQRLRTTWTLFSDTGVTNGSYWQVVGANYCSNWFDTYDAARDHLEKTTDLESEDV